EIVQPTIVETISFLAWRDEFYHLGSEWAKCYDEGSQSKNLIKEITESWYLVNIVDNDFRNERGIFPLFDGLKVEGVEPTAAAVNGVAPHVNGDAQHVDVEKKEGVQKPEVNGVPDKNNAVNHADGPAVNGEVKN
ncbi:hypothetical protein KC336_g20138, partial [Hortaea werneckii]